MLSINAKSFIIYNKTELSRKTTIENVYLLL